MQDICFVCSARDYHAIDWYRTVKNLYPMQNIMIATDLIEGENYKKLVTEDDTVILLFNIDRYLFKNQSKISNIWRNFIKLFAIPILAIRLSRISKNKNIIFHAHSMFYIFLCWIARIKYIATPMGSDVLVRPDNSWLYHIFTKLSLRGANIITVDSLALQEKIYSLCKRDSYLIQNGIDTTGTAPFRKIPNTFRTKILSIRGMDSNYRIKDIVKTRNTNIHSKISLEFIYPFFEIGYYSKVICNLKPSDIDHGRVLKDEMYNLLSKTCLAISIPKSDSSPRTVYEAIFCGACVAVTYNKWVELLPNCMRSRIIIVNLNYKSWLADALNIAQSICIQPYIPSTLALEMYDEVLLMQKVCKKFYMENINE